MREELERHLKKTYSDEHWEVFLSVEDGLSWPGKPTVAFNRNPPRIIQGRCKSVPGPNVVPYIDYKYSKVLRQPNIDLGV